eukprot:4423524-Prymnesium_polylepis.1
MEATGLAGGASAGRAPLRSAPTGWAVTGGWHARPSSRHPSGPRPPCVPCSHPFLCVRPTPADTRPTPILFFVCAFCCDSKPAAERDAV